MDKSPGAKTAIAVAVIGLIGVVLSALITGFMQRPKDALPERSPAEQHSVSDDRSSGNPQGPVQLIAAHVGRPEPAGPVKAVTTQFAPEDDIAVTLRIDANPSVVNFPMRIDGRLSGGINMYVAKQAADVSRPGLQEVTLRFAASDRRVGPLCLTVEFAGESIFSQEVSINER